jgi:N-acetylated-alpha-linked acidic dipeptidase
MKKLFGPLILSLLFAPGCLFSQEKTIRGFTAAKVADEEALEGKFDGLLKASDLDDWMKKLSAHPHHLGSAFDKANAEMIRDLFAQWGFNARIEKYKVSFPVPLIRTF